MDTYGVPSTHCIGSKNSTHVKYTPSVPEKMQLYHSAHKPINMQKDVCTPTFLFNKWAILERTQYCDGGRLREGRDASAASGPGVVWAYGIPCSAQAASYHRFVYRSSIKLLCAPISSPSK